MTTIATLEHAVPGRFRVRIPSKRGDACFFDAAAKKIRDHPDVHHVTATSYTGSVLIHHSGNADDILSLASELFELRPDDKPVQVLHAMAERSGLPAPVALDTAAAVTAVLGLYELARRGDLGTATENFWAAFGSYKFLESLPVTAAFAGVGFLQLLRGELFGSATSLLYYSLLMHQMAEFERKQKDAVGREGDARKWIRDSRDPIAPAPLSDRERHRGG
jgi:hypothetical protein